MEGGPGTHIVVVEDDQDISRVLKTILTMDGYRVSMSKDGISGLAMVQNEMPDLVILDVMMPGKDGLEVMQDLRADPATRHIPILFISAVGDESVVVQGLKGADDYMLKPFKSLELSARIEKILARSASRGRGARPLDRLPVQRGDETYLVPLREIYFIEASGKYSYVHTRNKRFLTGYAIGELERRLAETGKFMRSHRSYLVNTEYVQKVKKDPKGRPTLAISDEPHSEIPVSASYAQSVKNILGI